MDDFLLRPQRTWEKIPTPIYCNPLSWNSSSGNPVKIAFNGTTLSQDVFQKSNIKKEYLNIFVLHKVPLQLYACMFHKILCTYLCVFLYNAALLNAKLWVFINSSCSQTRAMPMQRAKVKTRYTHCTRKCVITG